MYLFQPNNKSIAIQTSPLSAHIRPLLDIGLHDCWMRATENRIKGRPKPNYSIDKYNVAITL